MDHGQFSVRAGSSLANSGGRLVKVAAVIEHPDYAPNASNDYDVTVLLLAGIIIGGVPQPIALATREPVDGSSVTVA